MRASDENLLLISIRKVFASVSAAGAAGLLASNFQTRVRAKRENSSLDQVGTKMISEIAF